MHIERLLHHREGSDFTWKYIPCPYESLSLSCSPPPHILYLPLKPWDFEIFTPKRCLVLLFSALRWRHPKRNESWIFIGRTDVEAQSPILRPPDAKSWLIWKDPEAGKDWRQEEKGMTEDEMVGWHHWLDGHEFEQAPGVGHEQGGLVCCSPRGCKESEKTEWLNWTEMMQFTTSFLVRWWGEIQGKGKSKGRIQGKLTP